MLYNEKQLLIDHILYIKSSPRSAMLAIHLLAHSCHGSCAVLLPSCCFVVLPMRLLKQCYWLLVIIHFSPSTIATPLHSATAACHHQYCWLVVAKSVECAIM